MKHITSKITALFCTMLMLQGIPTAAADGSEMTFRTELSRTYFTETELAEKAASLEGSIYIDHYTGLSSFRFELEADSALLLSDPKYTEPSFFSNPGEGTAVNPEKLIFLFNGAENLSTGEVMQNGIVAVPGGSLGQFHVTVPKGTPAGVYKIEFRDGFALNEVGQKEFYFFAYSGMDKISPQRLGSEVVVEPEAVRGDVNSDGKIDLADAMGALTYHNSTNSLGVKPSDADTAAFLGTPYIHTGFSAADVDGNSAVTYNDASYILSYYNWAESLQSPKPWEEILP